MTRYRYFLLSSVLQSDSFLTLLMFNSINYSLPPKPSALPPLSPTQKILPPPMDVPCALQLRPYGAVEGNNNNNSNNQISIAPYASYRGRIIQFESKLMALCSADARGAGATLLRRVVN